MRALLILDTNILIHLVEEFYNTDKALFHRVFSRLLVEYSHCWIPETVKKEFLSYKHTKKLEKRLDSLQKKYHVEICPITIAQHEISLLIGNKAQDAGEADALMQIKKACQSDAIEYHFEKLIFFSRDKKALSLAERQGIKVLDYNQWKNQLKETGIFIP
ncbi:type II toxin-antitoxin system VapC family toxin [Candidatus Venteria ishoeyi]|uniref:PIN domain-containing protein n=1 Tax=Candidatus Venteria ishoeyi TaxID=1899563 RepID=A0A1H6FFL2_9GAMM|nr:type II toxin-antitoxin system VapC family toxin [Candidatus Venteria ishoeyi]SEH08201.1 Uncharacterised protein [Candidatus Venteria ishoeyi]